MSSFDVDIVEVFVDEWEGGWKLWYVVVGRLKGRRKEEGKKRGISTGKDEVSKTVSQRRLVFSVSSVVSVERICSFGNWWKVMVDSSDQVS